MNTESLAQHLMNAPSMKKYRNMSPAKAIFIENITQHIKYYMTEIEYNLKTGLRVINEFKANEDADADECQQELIRVVKNVEECSAGIQRVLAQDGAPTYYLLHGRVAVFDDGMPIDSFVLHSEDESDDSSSDESDDEDGTERIMRRFGIRPAAQFTFSVTQTGDNVTVSDLETVYNHIPSLTQEQVEQMVMTPIVSGMKPTITEHHTITEHAVQIQETTENKPTQKKRGRPKKDVVEPLAEARREPKVPLAEAPSRETTFPLDKVRKPRAKKVARGEPQVQVPLAEPQVQVPLAEPQVQVPLAEPQVQVPIVKKRGRPKKESTEKV